MQVLYAGCFADGRVIWFCTASMGYTKVDSDVMDALRNSCEELAICGDTNKFDVWGTSAIWRGVEAHAVDCCTLLRNQPPEST